ncbi:Ras GTPase ras2 [Pseudocyphellaria aurata]|nr:Ras GTPase ras2 [Pseudocyphellaria aurata]
MWMWKPKKKFDRPRPLEIGVIGDPLTGKSALITMFCFDVFVDWHDTFNDDIHRKQVAIDGKICSLEFLELSTDTNIFPDYWKLWVQSMDGIAIIYSIDSRSSFIKVRDYYNKIVDILVEIGRDVDDFPLSLVGNKCDNITAREVSTAEGIALAREFRCEFFETSSKNDLRVEEPFFDIARAHWSRKEPQVVERDNASKRGSKATYLGLFRSIMQAFQRQLFRR